MPEEHHDLGGGLALQRVRHARMLLEGREEVRERRPFHYGELFEHDLALLEQLDNLRRAGPRLDLVGSRLYPRLEPAQAQVPLHGAGVAHRAGALQARQHAAHAGAGADLDA